MSEFSDRPFALGSLTGIRTFRVDKYGRLMATQLDAVWTPGENVARCWRRLIEQKSSFHYMMPSLSWTTTGYGIAVPSLTTDPDPKPQVTKSATDHQVGKLDCTCGFYAYFDDEHNPYHHAHDAKMVKAIIEGYGVVTVGTRGFRAAKAKLRALIIPARKVTPLTDQLRVNYPDVPVYTCRAAAYLDFPLTPPALPTPDTTPDFWTRETL